MAFLSNYKTTITGVAAVLGALAHLLTALAGGDTSTIIPDVVAISTGLGLVFAHDAGAAK